MQRATAKIFFLDGIIMINISVDGTLHLMNGTHIVVLEEAPPHQPYMPGESYHLFLLQLWRPITWQKFECIEARRKFYSFCSPIVNLVKAFCVILLFQINR